MVGGRYRIVMKSNLFYVVKNYNIGILKKYSSWVLFLKHCPF